MSAPVLFESQVLRHCLELGNYCPCDRIQHAGPTNSGKTYYALQRLQQARAEEGGGIFLALEVYERLNSA